MRTNVAHQLNQISPFHFHPSKLLHIHLGQNNCRSRAQSTWKHRRNITAKDSPVNAFTHISQLPPTTTKGSLSGLSVAVKDNIATSFLPTTCSSAMLKGVQTFVAMSQYMKMIVFLDFTSPFDATVVQLLQKSGADIVGKTNCDEFGMGYKTPANHYRPFPHLSYQISKRALYPRACSKSIRRFGTQVSWWKFGRECSSRRGWHV